MLRVFMIFSLLQFPLSLWLWALPPTVFSSHPHIKRRERTGICSYLWSHTLFWALHISCLVVLFQLHYKVVAINPFYKEERWSLEKLSNLPKVTQIGSNRCRTGVLNCPGHKSLDMLTIPLLFSKLEVTGFPRWYFDLWLVLCCRVWKN